ncbi:MAG: hypothetical protein AMS27_07565 [Bacteroides sp. SM23_62_1]|nr:MAG: hypothetical protein AMS27_07565 [Bacteroides sp. SM23_62_1]
MSKLLSVIALSFLFFSVCAQESRDTSYWKFGGLGSISVSQVSLTNWAAGGESSFSGGALVNTSLNYNRDNISWENLFAVAYGLMKQGDASVRKTDDKIDFASKFGRKASKKLFYSAMFRFNTQFTDGYKYPNDSVPISAFMAPGIINLSLGIDYKPSERLSIYIGPLSGKMTFVLDDSLSAEGAFGVEPGKDLRYEFGGTFKGMYTREILKNVIFTTKLELFSNYIKNPEKIDVSWEVLINMKINQYLSANLNTILVWDDDIKFAQFDSEGNYTGSESKVQFKEVFGIGLSYKF